MKTKIPTLKWVGLLLTDGDTGQVVGYVRERQHEGHRVFFESLGERQYMTEEQAKVAAEKTYLGWVRVRDYDD
jgi:hypothetical protein